MKRLMNLLGSAIYLGAILARAQLSFRAFKSIFLVCYVINLSTIDIYIVSIDYRIMRFPWRINDVRVAGNIIQLIILRNILWIRWTKTCSRCTMVTSPIRRYPRSSLHRSSRAKGNAITSWQETVSATCHPTVSRHSIRAWFIISFRQCHHIFPEGYPG